MCRERVLACAFVPSAAMGSRWGVEGGRLCGQAARGARVCPAMALPRPDREPAPERPGEDVDARLSRELRAKVRELYGSRENVAIKTGVDSVDFRVRTAPGGTSLTEFKNAWFTVWSIAALAMSALIMFAALVKTGAVHDGTYKESDYEIPSYGSRSYIDPYELLQENEPINK